MLLRYDHQSLIIPNLVSTNRYLLYHSDLISLSPLLYDNNIQNKKTRKSEPGYTSLHSMHSNQQQIQQNLIHHLILFTDILIITLKI